MRWALALLVFAVLVGLGSACSFDWEIGSGDPTADGAAFEGGTPANKTGECGATCICENNDTCRFTCSSSLCKMECRNNADCAMTCTGGTCALDCKDNAECDLDCSGGSCTYGCNSNGACGGNCKGGVCARNCQKSCAVDCTGGLCR